MVIYSRQIRILKGLLLLIIFIFCALSFSPVSITKAAEKATYTLEVIEIETKDSISALVKYLIQWAFRLAGLLAFIMIIYAGFQYLTAGGNVEQQKEAQERIFNAIIGIILLFSFWLILNTINPDILGKEEPSAPKKVEKPLLSEEPSPPEA